MYNEEDEGIHTYKDRYKLLFDTAQDGILLIDFKDGRVYDANKYLLEMLNYDKAEIVGKQLWELGFFKDVDVAKKGFDRLQDEGYLRYEDLPLRTKEGKEMEAEFVCNSYAVNLGKTIQCNIRNITDRKIAERKLEIYIKELETINGLMVGREVKMIELKGIIEKLKDELKNIKDKIS